MTKAKIFIVEDDDIIARTTEWRIKKMGHEFCGRASNGKEAEELIAKNPPDIVLMDINLGTGPDGITIADELKKKFDLSVIYLTARSDSDALSRAKTTHPNGYLVKPFDDKDLRVAIELAIKK